MEVGTVEAAVLSIPIGSGEIEIIHRGWLTKMDHLLAQLSPFVRDLIGMLAIMAGSVLLIGSLVLPRPQADREIRSPMPSLRNERIPPVYEANKNRPP